MAWRLVVEGELRSAMPDFHQPTIMLDPIALAWSVRSRRLLAIGRQQGIGEECMLDVGEDQFLVLLLMVQAKPDARF